MNRQAGVPPSDPPMPPAAPAHSLRSRHPSAELTRCITTSTDRPCPLHRAYWKASAPGLRGALSAPRGSRSRALNRGATKTEKKLADTRALEYRILAPPIELVGCGNVDPWIALLRSLGPDRNQPFGVMKRQRRGQHGITTRKIVVFAPIPSAKARIAIIEKAGAWSEDFAARWSSLNVHARSGVSVLLVWTLTEVEVYRIEVYRIKEN